MPYPAELQARSVFTQCEAAPVHIREECRFVTASPVSFQLHSETWAATIARRQSKSEITVSDKASFAVFRKAGSRRDAIAQFIDFANLRSSESTQIAWQSSEC
jgi:hypothetical protein